MRSVTANTSVGVDTPVTRNVGCIACDKERSNPSLSRSWGDGRHCTSCHEDSHRACLECGTCLPRPARFDRFYCSVACRHKVYQWRRGPEAAKQRAEREAMLADPQLAAKLESIKRMMAGDPKVTARKALIAQAREAAEGDLVGAAVIAYMAGRSEWTGSAGELLAALTPDRPPRGWPATARALSGSLRRLVAPLRSAGIAVAFTREAGSRGGRRLLTLTREESVPTVATVATVAPRTNGPIPTVAFLAPTVATVAPAEHEGDEGDGSDGALPLFSGARTPLRPGLSVADEMAEIFGANR